MTAQYSLSLPRNTFVIGEAITLEQTIVNTSSAPLELPDPEQNVNWQPVYTLVGPTPAQRRTIDLRSLVYGSQATPPAPASAALMTLDPGQSWIGGASVERLFKLHEAGSYELHAELTWGALALRTAPVTFTVRASDARATAIGMMTADASREFILLYADGGQIYRQPIFEQRPDLGEAKLHAAVPLAQVSGSLDQLLSPTSIHNRGIDDWTVWRSGDAAFAQSLAEAAPQTLPLGGAELVAPPWVDAEGALWVAALRPHSGDLEIARFERQLGPKSPPAAWVAKLKLGWTPQQATLALTRGDTPGASRLVLARQLQQHIVLETIAFHPPSTLQTGARQQLPDLALPTESRLAAQIDAGGNLHVWAIALHEGKIDAPVLIRAIFPADSQQAVGVDAVPLSVRRPLQSAQVAGFIDGSHTRFSAVLRLVDDTMVYVRPDATVAALRHAPAAGSVMELLVTSENSFLVWFQDGRFVVESLDALADG